MVAAKKKAYSRPELIYESFALSQDISSGCEAIAMFGENVCPVIYKGKDNFQLSIFQTKAFGCEYCPPNPDDFICYHAPSEMNNVFAS